MLMQLPLATSHRPSHLSSLVGGCLYLEVTSGGEFHVFIMKIRTGLFVETNNKTRYSKVKDMEAADPLSYSVAVNTNRSGSNTVALLKTGAILVHDKLVPNVQCPSSEAVRH